MSYSQQVYNYFKWDDTTKTAISNGDFAFGRHKDWKKYYTNKGNIGQETEIKKLIEESKKFLRRSVELAPYSAWHRYYLGCELIMWNDGGEEILEGKTNIEKAYEYLPDILEELEDQEFLERVRKEQWYKDLVKEIDSGPGEAT